MAGHTTKPYKNTFSGSVGAGMGSLFSPNGRKYYILEHKVTSKYHRAGESQEIIVDNIELGRDSHCQVRFDESFKTVSRHHAGIVKDGDMWKLVQISKTNSTFLNGRPVKTEWYLQNGDEIQLSVNGPKLGFITPTGKKSTVGSIGLTRRLSLFRQQALRPYKTAITVLSCLLVLAVSGLGTWNYLLSEELEDNSKALAEAREANLKNEALIKEQKKLLDNQGGLLDSLKKVKPQTKTVVRVINDGGGNQPAPANIDMSACYPYVYHMTATVYVDGEEFTGWHGTGFQLEEGKFVTARHVVCAYYSNSFAWNGDKLVPRDDPRAVFQDLWINVLSQMGRVKIAFKCVSPTNTVNFTSDQFSSVSKYDKIHTLSTPISLVYNSADKSWDLIGGDNIPANYEVKGTIPAGAQIRDGAMGPIDFAYATSKSSGGLKANKQIANNLKQGTPLHILGYPNGWGIGKPFYSNAVCAQDGLNSDAGGIGGTIVVSNNNTEGGNSGGPIFIQSGSSWEVVAIVSGRTSQKGRFVPISVIP